MKRALAVIVLSFALAAPAAGQGSRIAGDPARGEAMANRWCTSCHLVGGGKSGQDTAPPFAAIAHDPQRGPDYWRGFLAKPHPPMPPIQFSRQEIEDFVAYFGELAKR